MNGETIINLDALEQQADKLKSQINETMQSIKLLRDELESITETLYRERCRQLRDQPVWELKVNNADTLREAGLRGTRCRTIICSNKTWQEMYDVAVDYFAQHHIVGWGVHENSYGDFGQFTYPDGYNGGPVLGNFEIMVDLPHIIRASDCDED